MLFIFACEAAGASRARHSLRPLEFQMAGRTAKLGYAPRDRGDVLEIANQYFAVIASGAKQSIFDLAMPSHGLLRSARNDGDGAKQSHRVRGTIRKCEPVESPPSPARRMLATSPRKRGEVKNDREC
jgi:hypothetical protein